MIEMSDKQREFKDMVDALTEEDIAKADPEKVVEIFTELRALSDNRGHDHPDLTKPICRLRPWIDRMRSEPDWKKMLQEMAKARKA